MVGDEAVPKGKELQHLVVRVRAAHPNRRMESINSRIAKSLNLGGRDRLGMREPLRRLRGTDFERAQHVDDERVAHETDRPLGVFGCRPCKESKASARDSRSAAETNHRSD